MKSIAEEAEDARSDTAPVLGQTGGGKQEDAFGDVSDDATAVLAAQELDSHAQIDEMLQTEDVYTVSTLLRCEMQDFLLDPEAADAPNGDDGEAQRAVPHSAPLLPH